MDTLFTLSLGFSAGYILALVFYKEEINAGLAIVSAAKHAAEAAKQKAHDALDTVKTKAVAAINSL